ncbi:MAG: poly-beta-1,6-N-acetyl-D-glucosamine biosynthesis protein PgaD [Thiothrix sp.]|nr:MAG: poly-beta-1,6-N-acetyl-D-glucosamine biosynthesis protein PgaD [Thiothrix sp.]
MSFLGSETKSMWTVNFQDLIIDSPEKQKTWKRIGFFLLTLFFWGLWFFLWTPLPGLIGQLFTIGITGMSFRPATYVIVFVVLLLALISWQVGWLHYNLARFRTRGRRLKNKILGNQELGEFFIVDNNKLSQWQKSKCLVVKHDEIGEIEKIDVNHAFSFAPSLPTNETSNQDYQRHYVVLLPQKISRQLFNEGGNDIPAIFKVLCTVFNLKFISCQIAKNYLYLIVDIPASYNTEKVILQLKTASASIINKEYGKGLDIKPENKKFWRPENFSDHGKLDGQEILRFYAEHITTGK